MALQLTVNGRERQFDDLTPGAGLVDVVQALGLQPDRVAVERNGEIVSRSAWEQTRVDAGDRLEVVHFVGGGAGLYT